MTSATLLQTRTCALDSFFNLFRFPFPLYIPLLAVVWFRSFLSKRYKNVFCQTQHLWYILRGERFWTKRQVSFINAVDL